MKIYVVGRDSSVETLFSERGHEVHAGHIPNYEVDLVVFTGGSDIEPKWYGEENIHSYVSDYSKRRDEYEFGVYGWAKELGLPKAGICRGGQLFHIANGGKMNQHVDGHAGRNHRIHGFLEGGGSECLGEINSCHHQEMIPIDRAFVLAIADDDLAEVIFYPKAKDLCFQAHPEWGHRNTTRLFFNYINTCLGLNL